MKFKNYVKKSTTKSNIINEYDNHKFRIPEIREVVVEKVIEKEVEKIVEKEVYKEVIWMDSVLKLIWPPGEKGEKWDDWRDWKDGIDGKDGKDGIDWKDGIDGKDGKDGIDGKDWEDGKDGKSINIKWKVKEKKNLPAKWQQGDIYFVEKDGHLYWWDWQRVDMWKIRGDDGYVVYGWGGSTSSTWWWTVWPWTINEIAYFDTATSIASLEVATYPSLTELSYVKGVTSWIQAQLNAFANGMVYKWNRDASVWTFPWAWVTQTWWFYTVSVGWTVDSVVFNVWDRLIATTDNASTTVYASNWTQLDATDAVTSVNSQTGNVVLTTAEVADSSNKRYVTDANLAVIGNTSWTNTGDQTSIVWITGTLAEFNTALTGADFATLAWSEALTNKSVNWVTLVSGWTATKYLSEDGTYTTPAWWSWGWFWTAVPWSPTRTGNTTFTLTDTSNANLYDLLLCRWTVLKRTESSTLRQAMVVSATYSTNVVTVTIIWDTMTSIDASSLKYGLEKARTRRFAIAGTIGATGTNVANTVMVETPAKVYWCDFWAGTAGSGTTTLDINKWWTTMFTTKPSILTTGQNILWVTADTATTATTGDYITIDIDATAGTTKIIDAYVNLYRYPLYSSYLS